MTFLMMSTLVLLGLAGAIILPPLALLGLPMTGGLFAALGAYKGVKHLMESRNRPFGVLSEKARRTSENKRPRVLIVEDDKDVADVLAEIFTSVGGRATVCDGKDSAHLEMAFGNYDVVILDWRLSQHLTAGKVIKMADNLVELFPDLKTKFHENQPLVLTHSVLGAESIDFPESENFIQSDHWKKPFNVSTIRRRGRELVSAFR